MDPASFATVDELRQYITEEFFKACGITPVGWMRRFLSLLVRVPTGRFARIASDFDRSVTEIGFQKSAGALLPRFTESVRADGQASLPDHGPLILASNHPGTVDSLVVASQLPRDDLKIIVSGVPILQELVACRGHFIFSTRDAHVRLGALRESLRHLRAGGALLVFASAVVDPDPAVLPGAEAALSAWSASPDFFLKKVPESRLALSIVSGVLAPAAMRNPLIRLQTGRMERQRLAEFFQIIAQLVVPGWFHLHPAVSFSPPLGRETLSAQAGGPDMSTAIVEQARQVLRHHMVRYHPRHG